MAKRKVAKLTRSRKRPAAKGSTKRERHKPPFNGRDLKTYKRTLSGRTYKQVAVEEGIHEITVARRVDRVERVLLDPAAMDQFRQNFFDQIIEDWKSSMQKSIKKGTAGILIAVGRGFGILKEKLEVEEEPLFLKTDEELAQDILEMLQGAEQNSVKAEIFNRAAKNLEQERVALPAKSTKKA